MDGPRGMFTAKNGLYPSCDIRVKSVNSGARNAKVMMGSSKLLPTRSI